MALCGEASDPCVLELAVPFSPTFSLRAGNPPFLDDLESEQISCKMGYGRSLVPSTWRRSERVCSWIDTVRGKLLRIGPHGPKDMEGSLFSESQASVETEGREKGNHYNGTWSGEQSSINAWVTQLTRWLPVWQARPQSPCFLTRYGRLVVSHLSLLMTGPLSRGVYERWLPAQEYRWAGGSENREASPYFDFRSSRTDQPFYSPVPGGGCRSKACSKEEGARLPTVLAISDADWQLRVLQQQRKYSPQFVKHRLAKAVTERNPYQS